MKRLTTSLILLSLLSSLAFSQSFSTVKEGMKAVSEQYGMFFAYDSKLPVDQKYLGKDLKGRSLRNCLKELFDGTGIDWEINGKYILLTEAKPEVPMEVYATIGQQSTKMDTISPSVVVGNRGIVRSVGKLSSDVPEIRSIVSPLGEGDPVKWVQGLPGVTTGVDGSSAFYVRGGNSSNNLFSIDGVPVYGYSHLLGLTTVIPQSVISNAFMQKSGFDGNVNNFTSAHLGVLSRKVEEEGINTSFALNNFLISFGNEGRIKRFSYLLSARISPLPLEFKAVRNILPGVFGGLDNFRATVGDLYGKIRFDFNDRSWMEASGLGSIDDYSFTMNYANKDKMGWRNAIGMIRYHSGNPVTTFDATASVNSFSNSQEQDKYYRMTKNYLSLQSSLLEYSLHLSLKHYLKDGKFCLKEGVNTRFARFAPGQLNKETKKSDVSLMTGWLQAEYNASEKLFLKAMVRGNLYRNFNSEKSVSFQPEFSLSARWTANGNLSVEATVDRMAQYYHTLEGLPTGWSLDLIIPTGGIVLPELSWQGNVGLSGCFGSNNFTIGAFYKKMENLIYYKYSQTLFNGTLASWEDNVETGNGRSYGIETLYEFIADDWNIRASYTLSKTLREDFPSIYNGGQFPARFDRRHVLNASAQWKGFNATFIIQSGNWENGEGETYISHRPGVDWEAQYFSGVNNYHMPTMLRLDLGYHFDFTTGRVKHLVNLGICNVTNHFNPSLIIYDASTESWKELSIIPILPNFNYRIEF